MSDNSALVFNTALTASMGSSSTLGTIDISEANYVAAQYVWTGNPVGQITLSLSNDNVNFVDYDTPTPGGTPSTSIMEGKIMPFKYIKIAYTRTSGTGTLTVYVSGKR